MKVAYDPRTDTLTVILKENTPVAESDDVRCGLADAVAGRRRAGVCDDSGLTAPDAEAGMAQPDDLHGQGDLPVGAALQQRMEVLCALSLVVLFFVRAAAAPPPEHEESDRGADDR